MTIEVGDKVKIKGGLGTEFTVLYIHQKDERKWYVVAFMGDAPRTYTESELIKVPVKKDWFFYCSNEYYIVTVVDGVPDWTTVRKNENCS